MRNRLFLFLSALLLLPACSVDPSKHENLGPPQVVITAYDLAIKGDLEGARKYFSSAVQAAMKDPATSPAKVWEDRILGGHVKTLKISNQKEAGKDRVIIEGHVLLDTGQLQEVEELVIKEGKVWVIDGVKPKYSPGMPESLGGSTGGGGNAPAPMESGGQ